MIQSIGGMNAGLAAMRMQSQRPDPQKAFEGVDGNSDGSLNIDELQELIDMKSEKTGETGPSADELMAQLDSDGDGALSFAEFEAGRPQGPPPGGKGGPGGPGSMNSQAGMDLSQLFAGGQEEDEETLGLMEILI